MHKYEQLSNIPLISTLVVLILGIWGAVLNFAKREKEMRDYSLTKKLSLFFLDVMTSGGFALLTFYGLVGYGINETVSVAMSGIAAHQGTRFMYLFELFIATKFGTPEVVEEIKKGR